MIILGFFFSVIISIYDFDLSRLCRYSWHCRFYDIRYCSFDASSRGRLFCLLESNRNLCLLRYCSLSVVDVNK